ncbi:MAG: rhamnogalacturonan acetylesterase [Polyangiaceae bacterium]
MANSFPKLALDLACCALLGLSGAGCSSDAAPNADVTGTGSAGSAGAQPAGVAGAAGASTPGGGAPSGGAANSAGSSQGGAPIVALAGGGGASAGSANHAGSGGTAAGTAGAAGALNIAGAASSAGAANLPDVTVYLAGDSTVSQYTLDPNDPKSWAGWGQMLAPNYISKVKVVDAAVGGRTARRFIQEGSLDAILETIHTGDYLLVQFGTNDSNTTATYTLSGTTYGYFADAQTDFKTYLQQYIDGAKGKQAIPVLVTPPPRNSAYCKGPRSLANYGQAMIELGKADQVAVVDLGLKTHAYLTAICPKPTTAAEELFFKINADRTIDGTHFQENGARRMAGFVADGVDELELGLSAYRKP